MATLITNNDLANAASKLGCEVAVIRAIDEVESNGQGFKDGRIVIRFETKVFQKYTGVTINGSGQSAYEKAYKVNPRYALMSTSWGRYQIMGFNFNTCGFSSVEAFVATMKTGELAQLDAFIAFVVANQLTDELRKHDWAGFAKVYNGADYAKKGYHTKLAKAYERFKGSSTVPLKSTPVFDKTTIVVLAITAVMVAICFFLFRSSNTPEMVID